MGSKKQEELIYRMLKNDLERLERAYKIEFEKVDAQCNVEILFTVNIQRKIKFDNNG